MMTKEIDRQIYYYIIQTEVLLLMQYKVNPFDFSDKLSVSDLQSYMEILTEHEKEWKDTCTKDGGIWKHLMYIRDILNFISMKK